MQQTILKNILNFFATLPLPFVLLFDEIVHWQSIPYGGPHQRGVVPTRWGRQVNLCVRDCPRRRPGGGGRWGSARNGEELFFFFSKKPKEWAIIGLNENKSRLTNSCTLYLIEYTNLHFWYKFSPKLLFIGLCEFSSTGYGSVASFHNLCLKSWVYFRYF